MADLSHQPYDTNLHIHFRNHAASRLLGYPPPDSTRSPDRTPAEALISCAANYRALPGSLWVTNSWNTTSVFACPNRQEGMMQGKSRHGLACLSPQQSITGRPAVFDHSGLGVRGFEGFSAPRTIRELLRRETAPAHDSGFVHKAQGSSPRAQDKQVLSHQKTSQLSKTR